MPASTTLSTTTLSSPVGSGDSRVTVASTSGIVPGIRLWVDKELMNVVGSGVNNVLIVQRGVDGSASSAHTSSSTVTIGRADQFFSSDPAGIPPSVTQVSPYINVVSGRVWLAQGDTVPDGNANRWWQDVTNTYGYGSLGIISTTGAPLVAS